MGVILGFRVPSWEGLRDSAPLGTLVTGNPFNYFPPPLPAEFPHGASYHVSVSTGQTALGRNRQRLRPYLLRVVTGSGSRGQHHAAGPAQRRGPHEQEPLRLHQPVGPGGAGGRGDDRKRNLAHSLTHFELQSQCHGPSPSTASAPLPPEERLREDLPPGDSPGTQQRGEETAGGLPAEPRHQ